MKTRVLQWYNKISCKIILLLHVLPSYEEKKEEKNGLTDSGDKRLRKDEGLDSLAECF